MTPEEKEARRQARRRKRAEKWLGLDSIEDPAEKQKQFEEIVRLTIEAGGGEAMLKSFAKKASAEELVGMMGLVQKFAPGDQIQTLAQVIIKNASTEARAELDIFLDEIKSRRKKKKK